MELWLKTWKLMVAAMVATWNWKSITKFAKYKASRNVRFPLNFQSSFFVSLKSRVFLEGFHSERIRTCTFTSTVAVILLCKSNLGAKVVFAIGTPLRILCRRSSNLHTMFLGSRNARTYEPLLLGTWYPMATKKSQRDPEEICLINKFSNIF